MYNITWPFRKISQAIFLGRLNHIKYSIDSAKETYLSKVMFMPKGLWMPNITNQCNYSGCGFRLDIIKDSISTALLTVIDVIVA